MAIGKGENVEAIPDGAIVRIDASEDGARGVDRTVASVAEANGGRYNVEPHLHHDPSANEAFAQTHVRQLDAMRRLIGTSTRKASGQWVIFRTTIRPTRNPMRRGARATVVAFEILSVQLLATLPDADAETWLDHRLLSPDSAAVRAARFGADLR
ncbi:DUF3363 domain-containing protein [Sphingomonas panacisoli]|uniref:DUF3363 domain-containing protein n=1 Tax=Sphingomonas panacisoli TaxID=1813879 RepID=UPI0023D8FF4E|nr:DUF3363 domain-containing protein [Sphingomonas panacisoli]